MRICIYKILFKLIAILFLFSCNNAVNLKFKQNQLQSFLDSNEMLNVNVTLTKNYSLQKSELQVLIKGMGQDSNEYYHDDAQNFIAGYIFYKFFSSEPEINKYDFRVIYEHSIKGEPVQFIHIPKENYDEVVEIFSLNPCLQHIMDYLIKKTEPKEFFLLDVGLFISDTVLNLHSQPRILTTIEGMSTNICIKRDSVLNEPNSIRLLILAEYLKFENKHSTVTVLNNVFRIVGINPEQYDLEELFAAYRKARDNGLFEADSNKK